MPENEKLRALLDEARDAVKRSMGAWTWAGYEDHTTDEKALLERIDAALAAPPEQEETEHAMHLRIRAGYDKTIADAWRAKVAEVEKERDEVRTALANAYRRGAEDMREQVASLFDGSQNVPGLMKSPEFRDFIRDLSIPEDK